MTIAKTLFRPVALAGKKQDKAGISSPVKDRIITSAVVIAVLLVISTIVWLSMNRTNPDKSADPGNVEINIIQGTGGDAATETEYIEYEAPDNAF